MNLLNKVFTSVFGEYLIVIYLLAFWISPEFILNIDPQAGSFLEFFWFLEFVFGHTTCYFAIILSHQGIKRGMGLAAGILIYGLFFLALIQKGFLIQVILYMFITSSRFYRVFLNAKNVFISKEILISFARVMFLLATAMVAVLPVPALGITEGMLNSDGSSKGFLVAYPQKLIFWYIVYFSFIGRLEKLLYKNIPDGFDLFKKD